MTQRERDELRREKAERLSEEDLRLKVRSATKQCLADLMRWTDITEKGEALTLLIHNVQGYGRFGVRHLAAPSLHRIESSEVVERGELRLKVMPGTIAALDALRQWLDLESYDLVIDAIVEAAFAAGPVRASQMMALPPRETYAISPAIALKLDQACKSKALIASV